MTKRVYFPRKFKNSAARGRILGIHDTSVVRFASGNISGKERPSKMGEDDKPVVFETEPSRTRSDAIVGGIFLGAEDAEESLLWVSLLPQRLTFVAEVGK